MESKTPSQTKARLLVLAVFVIGFLGGALSMNLYERLNPSSPPKKGSRNGNPPQHHILEKMTERLKLSPQQQEGIKAVLDNTFGQYGQIRKDIEPQMDAVRQQGRERIRAILSPEQLPEYEKMVDESNKRRERYREKEKPK